MPIPVPEALAAQEDMAAERAELARSALGRYLAASLLAGAYVGAAVVVLLVVSAPLVVEANPFTRLLQGSVFGLALVLVVFAGAELFTGNTMVMVLGLVRRRVDLVDVVLVWAASLAGNVVGGLGLAALVDATGLLTTGGRPGSLTSAQAALGSLALGSSSLTGGQLFLRAVLCNALACLALWMAARATSDTSRLIVLWWAVLAFVVLGFEYSVANVTTLSLAAMSGIGEWGDLGRNLVYTLPGNLIGGGLLVGAVYGWLGRPLPDPAAPALAEPVVEPPVDEPAAAVPIAEEPPRRSRARKASKATARKTTARKTTARKASPAKRTPAKRTPAKRTPAKRTPAKRPVAKRTTTKRTPAKRTPAKRRTTTRRTR